MIENNEVKKIVYLSIRFIEGICAATFIFGLMWHGTETLMLTMPEFMMLYGGLGAITSEIIARILNRSLKKK